ncbi:MAG: hypothetical protein WC054_00400 [Candidatus Nanopelagicales bacterium]
MADIQYGHLSDGTFRPKRVSDLCDWLIEVVFRSDLDASGEDRELHILRSLLRRRREYVEYLDATALCFDNSEWINRARARAHRFANDTLAPSEYRDPVEERLRDQGFVLGVESAIMHLADRYHAFEGIGGIYRAPERVGD